MIKYYLHHREMKVPIIAALIMVFSAIRPTVELILIDINKSIFSSSQSQNLIPTVNFLLGAFALLVFIYSHTKLVEIASIVLAVFFLLASFTGLTDRWFNSSTIYLIPDFINHFLVAICIILAGLIKCNRIDNATAAN